MHKPYPLPVLESMDAQRGLAKVKERPASCALVDHIDELVAYGLGHTLKYVFEVTANMYKIPGESSEIRGRRILAGAVATHYLLYKKDFLEPVSPVAVKMMALSMPLDEKSTAAHAQVLYQRMEEQNPILAKTVTGIIDYEVDEVGHQPIPINALRLGRAAMGLTHGLLRFQALSSRQDLILQETKNTP